MDNLYGQYLVTRAEVIRHPIEDDKWLEVYKVELLGDNNHRLSFGLVLKNMDGGENPDRKEVFECIAPHIQKGQLLHIALAFQFHRDSLNLCMVGFKKCQSRRWSDGEVMNPRDFFNSNRGYWTVAHSYGEWIYPPHGLIGLGGESAIPMDLSLWPKFCKYQEIDKSEYVLTWQKRLTKIRSLLSGLLQLR